MPTSPTHQLRSPVGTDPADIPLRIQQLVDDLEAELGTRIAAAPILDVGQAGQRRAGRVLTAADFTDLGLAAPAGLWNLSDLTDASGNARALTNKGAVPFGKGILGAAGEAAVFAGSTGQALWRADEAALSIRTGSWGCWFRTAKRGVNQTIIAKVSTVAGQRSFGLTVLNGNTLEASVYSDGTANVAAVGVSDVADDRWHFAVVTFDGATIRLYVDGVLEAQAFFATLMFDGTAPFNIGAFGADAGTAGANPFYGRVDEAFVTPEILSEDQIRCLMAVKIAHGSTRSPRRVNLSVRRLRRGPLLAVADFTALGLAQPVRLHNLDGLADLGSGGVALTVNGGVTAGGAAGPAGKAGGGTHFDGVDDYFSATDAGLPTGTAARTLLAWFKTNLATNRVIIAYGTITAGQHIRIEVNVTGNIGIADGSGSLAGPYVADGQWHQVAIVMDNAAADGVKRKLYLDGRLVAGDTTFNSTVLGGANALRIGSHINTTLFWQGQLARAAILSEAMTLDQVAAIWAKGTQDLGRSPYPAGEYVERLDDSGLYVLADRGTLEDQEQVELEVAA